MPKKAKWPVSASLNSWGGEVLALASGATLNLAFAPYRHLAVVPLVLALCYGLVRAVSRLRAALRGFLLGVGLFAFGVPWIYLTLARFGGMPSPVAVIACGLFVAVLSAYIALVAAVFAVLRRGDGFDPWLFAALWVMGEWVRNVFLTGFPWFDLGYAASAAPWVSWAPIAGVLGLSFILALAGALLFEAACGRWRGLWPLVLFLIATPFVARIRFVRRTETPVTASLVQGDISPYAKWDPRERRAIIHRYLRLTRQGDGRLVIWPETAVPGYSHSLRRRFIPFLRHLARIDHRHFLFGLVEGNPDRVNEPIYNAVMSVGRHDGVYRKRHLVPFGEYLPWPSLFDPILRVLHIPMSGFTPWRGREAPLVVSGADLGMSICYEIAYGSIVTQALPSATLLVNVSDDSWYGHSHEASQQLQIAQLRAAEAGRDLLIATNDGMTALVTHRGHISVRLPPFRPGVLTVVAEPYRGLTPYDRIGNDGVLAFVSLIGLIAARRWTRDRHRRRGS